MATKTENRAASMLARPNEIRPEYDTDALKLTESLFEEANGYRSGKKEGGSSFEDQWEVNGQRYLGNHWSTASSSIGLVEGYRVVQFTTSPAEFTVTGLRRATLNRVQANLLSNVAGKTQQPIAFSFDYQEYNDDPEMMLTPRGGRTLAKMRDAHALEMAVAAGAMAAGQPVVDAEGMEVLEIQPEEILLSFTDGQLIGDPVHGPVEQLTDDQGEYVRNLIDGDLFDRDDLIEMNDKWVSKVGQELWDHLWDEAWGEAHATHNEFLCTVFGHQPIRIQWHAEGAMANRFTLENTHILNVWIDPLKDSVGFLSGQSGYLIFEYPVTLDEAKELYPDHVDALTFAAEEGKLKSDSHRRGGVFDSIDFQRKMVVVRTTWIRYQPYPMSEDEAVEAGLVEPRMVDNAEEEAVRVVLGEEEAQPVPQVQDGWVLAATGKKTDPNSDNWPTRTGLRQITTLPEAKAVVEDIECPYMDMPWSWNVNIPIPYSPYGQGDPARLEDIQRQINRILSVFGNYLGYYQFPMRYWRASVLQSLKQKGVQFHSRPGAEIPLPDEDYDRLAASGKACITQEIPLMPPVLMQVLEMLLREMDRLSGNVDVRQGIPPGKNMSGEALNALRQESYGPLGLSARFTESCFKRIGIIGFDAAVRLMDEEAMMEVLDRYKLPVIRMWRERVQHGKWDIKVRASLGSGSNREQEEQRAISLRREGLLSRSTTMREVHIDDPDAEEQRIQDEAMEMATASAPVQAAATDNIQQAG